MEKSKIALGFAIAFIFSLVVFSQEEVTELEAWLSGTSGKERLEIWLRLTKAYKMGNIREYAGALLYLVKANKFLGNYDVAIDAIARAQSFYEQLGQSEKMAGCLHAIGLIYRRLNHCSKALEFILCYKSLEDFPRALSYLKRAKEMKEEIADLQSRFDIERKEQEISLLRKDTQIQQLDLKRQKNLKNTMILVTILIMILAFAILARYRLKVKEVQAELVRKERLSLLGQLTATVAHEIRNPLGTVRSTIFSMRKALEKSDISRTQRALQLAERNIVRCDKIIDDLLNFTLLRQLKPEATPIDSWLEVLLKEQTLPEGIHCAHELNAGIEVSIDRERFRRAVINVLDNAVSALLDPQAQGNCLTVGSLVADHRLEIRVSDTGLGIPAETRKRIFEPLFTTKSFGFGLGLPVVKNIMEEHGGGVEILSQEKQGTTVLLWLPL